MAINTTLTQNVWCIYNITFAANALYLTLYILLIYINDEQVLRLLLAWVTHRTHVTPTKATTGAETGL